MARLEAPNHCFRGCVAPSSKIGPSFWLVVVIIFLAIQSLEPVEGWKEDASCSFLSSPALELHPTLWSFHIHQVGDESWSGSELTFRCKSGYRLRGCSKVACTHDGWKCVSDDGDSFPECIPTPLCPPLPEFVQGGSWRLASYRSLDQFAPGDVATLSCSRPGFMVNGSPKANVTCILDKNESSETARWNVEVLPSCDPVTCEPIIPAALPSGVIVTHASRYLGFSHIIHTSPFNGASALEGTEFSFDCISRPSLPTEYGFKSSSYFGGAHGMFFLPNISVLGTVDGVTRVGRYSSELMAKRVSSDPPPQNDCPRYPLTKCPESGRWCQMPPPPEYLRVYCRQNCIPVSKAQLSTCKELSTLQSSDDSTTPESGGFPHCSHVNYREDRKKLEINVSRDQNWSLCPPLPWFKDSSIPGWIDKAETYASNSLGLHSIATLKCGHAHWPERSSTATIPHSRSYTAKCEPFYKKFTQAKISSEDGEHDDDDDDEMGEDAFAVLGRWVIRHDDGTVWTGSVPPTCVPKPRCNGLPKYSGWRVPATKQAPDNVYAGDTALCLIPTPSGQISEVRHILECKADPEGLSAQFVSSQDSRIFLQSISSDSHHEAAAPSGIPIDPSTLICEDVICPHPPRFSNAFQDSRNHTNFRGRIDLRSLIDPDVRLDYFSFEDTVEFRCHFGGGGFDMECSHTGEWSMVGEPCPNSMLEVLRRN